MSLIEKKGEQKFYQESIAQGMTGNMIGTIMGQMEEACLNYVLQPTRNAQRG